METKLCKRCQQEKPLDQFDRDPRNTGPRGKGVASGCKACRRAQEAAWKVAHPEHVKTYQQGYYRANKADKRDRDLRRKYHITAAEYDAMLAAQGGHCAICPATEAGGNGVFHVDHDHDHETGRVRGLLCHACNTALGLFKESADLLAAAMVYLRFPPAQPCKHAYAQWRAGRMVCLFCHQPVGPEAPPADDIVG